MLWTFPSWPLLTKATRSQGLSDKLATTGAFVGTEAKGKSLGQPFLPVISVYNMGQPVRYISTRLYAQHIIIVVPEDSQSYNYLYPFKYTTQHCAEVSQFYLPSVQIALYLSNLKCWELANRIESQWWFLGRTAACIALGMGETARGRSHSGSKNWSRQHRWRRSWQCWRGVAAGRRREGGGAVWGGSCW